MLATIKQSKLTLLLVIFYLILLLWWLKIFFSGQKTDDENYIFGLAYGFMALIGGVNGLLVSRIWGGFHSLIGRGVSFLSIGLLCYFFGQTTWSFYNLILRVEVPYPSLADFGYFSVIPVYTYAAYCFARASGAKNNFNKLKGKIIALIIPLVMLSTTYFFFLHDMEINFSDPIKTFLDFGTPLGYSVVISMTLIAYFLSKNMLGGAMKSRILIVIGALIFQNITDNTFLYQYSTGSYYNAGINDLMFATAFALMSISLIS